MTNRSIMNALLRPAMRTTMVTALLGAGIALAQSPGSLDPTFGTGGIVTGNFGGHNEMPLTAIEQPGGDIVVVAGFNNEIIATEAFGLTRYTSSGKLDTTFGKNGVTLVAFTNFLNMPSSVAVQPDGDIVVAGTAETTNGVFEFAMARFKSNGQLDSTFGSGGLVTTQPAGADPWASVVMVQPNGKILVGGFVIGINRHTSGQTVLARYNSDGSLDTTFGTGGIAEAVTAVGSPTALAHRADGSYLAVGQLGAAAEFSSTGVLQSTVKPGTLVATSQPAAFSVNPVIFQPNGDYIVGQTIGDGFQRTEDQIFRFSQTGVVDSSFSSTPFGFPGVKKSSPQTLALQTNGQVLVGGVPFGVARLNSNGELDTTFGSGGTVETPGTQVTGLLVQTDGKIVVIGAGGPNGTEELLLARYFGN